MRTISSMIIELNTRLPYREELKDLIEKVVDDYEANSKVKWISDVAAIEGMSSGLTSKLGAYVELSDLFEIPQLMYRLVMRKNFDQTGLRMGFNQGVK